MPILNTLRLTLITLSITLISSVSAEQYALVSDGVIDGKSNELLENKAVIVTDSKITGIVALGLIPEQAVRVNLPGTTLMPGMINVHEHPLLYKMIIRTVISKPPQPTRHYWGWLLCRVY